MFGLGRRQKPTPAPLEGSAEARLITAAMDCDHASAALSEALAARRAAMVDLVAATRHEGKAVLNRQFSPSFVWSAISFHGAGVHLGLPHVLTGHRASFLHHARASIGATASARTDPSDRARTVAAVDALLDPAPAVPGLMEHA